MQSSGNHPDLKISSKKQKRNRRETECSVKRRNQGCGICGSENIAIQGVLYCDICGEESPYLVEYRWNYGQEYNAKVNCDRVETWTHRGKERSYRKIKLIGTFKCMDCGAVGRESFCPNNQKGHRGYNGGPSTCWKHWNGGIYCQNCGFRNL